MTLQQRWFKCINVEEKYVDNFLKIVVIQVFTFR